MRIVSFACGAGLVGIFTGNGAGPGSCMGFGSASGFRAGKGSGVITETGALLFL
jgi:hypothetical protein